MSERDMSSPHSFRNSCTSTSKRQGSNVVSIDFNVLLVRKEVRIRGEKCGGKGVIFKRVRTKTKERVQGNQWKRKREHRCLHWLSTYLNGILNRAPWLNDKGQQRECGCRYGDKESATNRYNLQHPEGAPQPP